MVATEAQVRAVERFYNTTIDFRMSGEQANKLLSIRDYVRAITESVRREGLRVMPDHERIVAAWIINSPGLTEHVTGCSDRRFARGDSHADMRPRHTVEYQAIRDRMLEVVRA